MEHVGESVVGTRAHRVVLRSLGVEGFVGDYVQNLGQANSHLRVILVQMLGLCTVGRGP